SRVANSSSKSEWPTGGIRGPGSSIPSTASGSTAPATWGLSASPIATATALGRQRTRTMIRSFGPGVADLLADPAILGDRLAGGDRLGAGIRHLGIVEGEIQQEDDAGIGAAEIEARPQHANRVADAQPAATGQAVRARLITGQLVGIGVIDDHG